MVETPPDGAADPRGTFDRAMTRRITSEREAGGTNGELDRADAGPLGERLLRPDRWRGGRPHHGGSPDDQGPRGSRRHHRGVLGLPVTLLQARPAGAGAGGGRGSPSRGLGGSRTLARPPRG